MVPAKESRMCQESTAWNPPNVDHMALPQLEQNSSLPYFPPSTFTANVDFPVKISDLHPCSKGQDDAVNGFRGRSPSCWDISYPVGNSYLKDSRFALGEGIGSKELTDVSCAPQRRFIIFDKSRNNTRLFFSPMFSWNNESGASISKTPVGADGFFYNMAELADQKFSVNPILEEKWDENHLTNGEDEMREDTEEINALLYSDSDDEYDDGENDEVTSMSHPSFSIKQDIITDKLLEEPTQEVASSNGTPKRQRLLDGRYKKSSLVSDKSPTKWTGSSSYEDDAESSCACNTDSYDTNIASCKRDKKVKIREALKILEGIIPGLKNNDPLSIIEEAIAYLKSLKIEAESLVFCRPECGSTAYP